MGLAVTKRSHRATLPSYEEFFEDEYPRLVRTLYLLVGGADEAQEIAQGAMVRVLERWDRVANLESPRAYVFRVALNLHRRRVRSLLRMDRLERALSRGQFGESPDPARLAEARVDTRRILASMPRAYREILVLSDWLGLNSQEMAKLLRISPANARVRLHRARQAFRLKIGEGYV